MVLKIINPQRSFMRIREIREDKGISQKALAILLGVSPTNIYNYEIGRTEPSVEMLKKIAGALEVSIDYLVGNSDDFGNITISNGSAELSEQEKELLKHFNKLGIFERDSILIQVKALAEKQLIKK